MNLTELCFDFQTLIYVPVTPTHSFFLLSSSGCHLHPNKAKHKGCLCGVKLKL